MFSRFFAWVAGLFVSSTLRGTSEKEAAANLNHPTPINEESASASTKRPNKNRRRKKKAQVDITSAEAIHDEIGDEEDVARPEAPIDRDHLSNLAFEDLGLNPILLNNVHRAGFSYCTPIQAEALPILLQGKDVAGQAQTGTGKTATFLLGAFQRLMATSRPGEKKSPRMLVLAPTRELAIQIHKDAKILGEGLGFRLGLAYGGVDYEKQRLDLEQGVDILVGTPGRLIDYYKQRVYSLDNLEVMVLDEADRMFDLGFIKDIRFLLRSMPAPAERLNMLFSATLSAKVQELAYEHMNEPQTVRIEPEQITVDRVKQMVYHVANEEKIPLLIGLLRTLDPGRTMIFLNTRGGVDKVSRILEANGFSVGALSGDVPQRKREKLLGQLQNGELDILVATDVAARGLHINDITHVFNYDLPQDAEDYVHRIGRTARAGAKGDAISFGCETHVFALPEIEALIGFPIPVVPVDESLLATDIKRPKPSERPPQKNSERPRSGQGGRRRA